MFTRALARELSGHGIRVVGIAPGMVHTPLNEDKEPREIGYLAAFLASDRAFNIQGTVVDSTGGMLI